MDFETNAFASSSARPIPAPAFGAPIVRPTGTFAESARRGLDASFGDDDEDDPVRASAARAKALLERAQAEQVAQMRALHQFGGGSRGGSGSGSRSESATGRRRGEEAEDEEVRRAIAESLKAAGLPSEDPDVEVEDDDENVSSASLFCWHLF